jgi:tRNA threonylcarbamoyladenosine biosynthesis protein TsaE
MQHYKTILLDEAATLALGKRLASCLSPGLVIYLHGDLGAGKTALTRSILHAAGHQGNVKSPTYTLAEPYQIVCQGQACKVMHFDLYRMISPDEFIEAGFRDEFNAQTICIIEWPEKAEGLLPQADLDVFFSILDEGREVNLQAHSTAGQTCLEQLHFVPNL